MGDDVITGKFWSGCREAVRGQEFLHREMGKLNDLGAVDLDNRDQGWHMRLAQPRVNPLGANLRGIRRTVRCQIGGQEPLRVPQREVDG
jgi:hypothetical protein